MGYHEQIMMEAYKDRENGEFPFSLGVEVTNHCNLRCPMCPREVAERGYGNMDWDLFTSIADQASGREKVIFLPQGFGESLMHPQFRAMLKYLNEHDVRVTMLVSNATYLDDLNCNAIIDSSIPFINISMDGTVKDIYEKIRVNATYEKVVENIQRLFRIRKERGAKLPHIIMRMIKMEETVDDVAAFEAMWEPYLEEHDEIVFSNYQTWSNTVEDKRTETPEGMVRLSQMDVKKKPPCRMVYKTLQVYYDGRATPCCYDYDCTMEIGNANEQSIEEIWTGEKAQEIRRIHEEGRMDEIDICRGCQEYIP